MKNTKNKLAERLSELAASLNFRGDYDNAVRSSEELYQMGRHNLEELEKLASLDDETRERIIRLCWLLVARELQKEALVQYGVADETAIRQILEALYYEPRNKAFCDRVAQLSEEGMAEVDMTEEQRRKVVEYFRLLPRIQIEAIVRQVSTYRNVPLESSVSIADKLRDFVKEVSHEEHQ